jgi:hypothetical protein
MTSSSANSTTRLLTRFISFSPLLLISSHSSFPFFSHQYGIEISNIRIESFKISDKELAGEKKEETMGAFS